MTTEFPKTWVWGDPETIDYNAIDPAIRDLVKQINSTDWIRTTMSCSGHPVDVRESTSWGRGGNWDFRRYERAVMKEPEKNVHASSSNFVTIIDLRQYLDRSNTLFKRRKENWSDDHLVKMWDVMRNVRNVNKVTLYLYLITIDVHRFLYFVNRLEQCYIAIQQSSKEILEKSTYSEANALIEPYDYFRIWTHSFYDNETKMYYFEPRLMIDYYDSIDRKLIIETISKAIEDATNASEELSSFAIKQR